MWLQRLPPNKEARVYKKRKGGYHFRTNCSNFSTDKLNRITKLILVHFSTQYSQIFLINEYLVSDPLPWSDVIWWFCSNGQDKSVKSRVSRYFLSCFVCHSVIIAGLCPGLVISWFGVMSYFFIFIIITSSAGIATLGDTARLATELIRCLRIRWRGNPTFQFGTSGQMFKVGWDTAHFNLGYIVRCSN